MRACRHRRRLLFAYVVRSFGWTRALRELRASWRQWLVIGAIANAVPFWLVAWGEKHVDSGIAAIAQSTVPLFTIVLGLRFLPHEPLSRGQLLGFGLGLVGVGVLAGGHPDGGWWAIAGTLAVVLSSLAYASRERDRPAKRVGDAGARARDRRDDRSDGHPASVRRPPGPDVDARRGRDPLAPRARPSRHGACAARALPHAEPLRRAGARASSRT